jgi:hypothetical protein
VASEAAEVRADRVTQRTKDKIKQTKKKKNRAKVPVGKADPKRDA